MSKVKVIKRKEKYTFLISYRFKHPMEARIRLNTSWNELSKANVSHLGAVHLRWTGSPRWDDFYPTFIWNLLTLFIQSKSLICRWKKIVIITYYNYVLFKQKIFFYEAQKGCSSFVLLYKIIYYAILLVWLVT